MLKNKHQCAGGVGYGLLTDGAVYIFSGLAIDMASGYNEKATQGESLPTKKKTRMRVDIGDNRSLMVITELVDTVSKFAS